MEQKSRRRSVDAKRPVEVAKGRATIQTVRVRSRQILSDETREQEFDSEVFLTDPAYVRVAVGTTKSIGDYESLRIDVAITMPCYKEKVDETAAAVGERLGQLFQNELDQYGISLT